MGKNTVEFKCHHCGHCCSEVVCLPTPWDVVRMVKDTKENPYEFLEFIPPDEISEVAKSDPTWLRIKGKRYMMALKRDAKKGCYFRENGKCRAYLSRPLLCRTYPMRLQETRNEEFKGFTLHNNVGCPKHRDGVVECKPLYEIYQEDKTHQDDYADLVEVFNDNADARSKPEDFVEMFVKAAKRN